jgi:ferritin-like metal-binding protein YciE
MLSGLLRKIFGSRNERLLKQYSHTVRAINALEAGIEKLSDHELRAKTDEFRSRVQQRLEQTPDNADGDAGRTQVLEGERDRARKTAARGVCSGA